VNREHARRVLAQELEQYSGVSYAQLVGAIGDLRAYEVASGKDTPYQVEIQVVWDARLGGAIRILGAIDDGGWSAFNPLCDDLLVMPENEILGP
jgi:hypothetical protein